MKKSRITRDMLQAKVTSMRGVSIADCWLKYERHWGYIDYWLVFTEEDLRGEKLHFNTVQEVWDWLTAFEKDHPSSPLKNDSGQ